MASYNDIKKRIAELERKATLARKVEIAKIVAGIRKNIADYDLTPEDLFGRVGRALRKAGKPKRINSPKYRDPGTGKTWTGFGKPPGWIIEAAKKGRKDDLLIDKPAPVAAPKGKPDAGAKSPRAVAAMKAAEKPAKAAAKPAKARADTKAKAAAAAQADASASAETSAAS